MSAVVSASPFDGKKQVVIPVRHQFLRRIKPMDWTDITIAVCAGWTGLTGENQSFSQNSKTIASNADRFYFGLRDRRSLNTLPGNSQCNFVGTGTGAGAQFATLQHFSSGQIYYLSSTIAINGTVSYGANEAPGQFNFFVKNGATWRWNILNIKKTATQFGVRFGVADNANILATPLELKGWIESVDPTADFFVDYPHDVSSPLDTVMIYSPFNHCRLKLFRIIVINNTPII